MFTRLPRSLGFALFFLLFVAPLPGWTQSSADLPGSTTEAATSGDLAEGKRLYRINCAGCHKWHGGGGGGYGGDALSLRKTKFDRAQIIETVSCGRPGTGMPYHRRDAYQDGACYGLHEGDVVGNGMVLAANNFLRPQEIGAIADYVLADIKGHGEPNYQECLAFFGTGSRVCDIYAPGGGEQKAAP
ncbi:MAG: cytochrome c [Acidibrevibacterium sp.]|jgi:mono/diheme cytochrome c family protein|uniref:c-type cytochrome n=1 Tax=Acidibrevibacterium fodinaquatile TaxID=1969806 RepID=UPI000E0D0FDA|nr:cytochrome c [Acidibrevibacterium fodinaquatile]MCA7119904.1 cytochrome c [Acidibrevibacterium fodinaquatile]